MATLNNVATYKVSSEDSFFFDTNIWILLFAPIANVEFKRQNSYAVLLQNIQKEKAKIKISSLVLSEFINAYMRICFNVWKQIKEKENPNNKDIEYKKDFKGTQDYLDAIEEVKFNSMLILKIANKIPDGFMSIDMEDILNNIKDKDFNDAYYLEMCKINKIKIVTDDRDFLLYNGMIEIITDRKFQQQTHHRKMPS